MPSSPLTLDAPATTSLCRPFLTTPAASRRRWSQCVAWPPPTLLAVGLSRAGLRRPLFPKAACVA